MSSLNSYKNAEAIYANKNWKFWSPYLTHVPVLYNTKNGNAFTITAGGRKNFTYNNRTNNGQAVYKYGPGNFNYVKSNLVYEARGHQKKRSVKTNTTNAYKARLANKPAQNKKKEAQKTRVNKLEKNLVRGKNINNANLANLVQLFMRYQSSNAGGYYVTNTNGRIKRNGNNGPEEPNRNTVLANIQNWINYNTGPFRNKK